MLRRLLTCLALITGLAGVGAPVNAAMVDTLSSQVGTSVVDADPNGAECSACADIRTDDARREAAKPANRRASEAIIHVPTVLLGADRAHE